MSNFSIYKNYQDVGTMNSTELIKAIRDGLTKMEQDTYRAAKAMGEHDKLKNLKDKFLAYTPSGTYNSPRIKNDKMSLIYTSEINIDIDKISSQGVSIFDLKATLIKDQYARLVFTSVGGDGLSVTIKTNSLAKDHTYAAIQCQNYITKLYNVKVDPACKDITRLRYIPHDPEMYFNPNSKVFQIIPEMEFNVLESEVKFTSNKLVYEEGSRNNFIYQLSCNANRKGIDQALTEAYALNFLASDGVTIEEIKTSVKSAYSHSHEHGVSVVSAGSVASAASATSSPRIGSFIDTPSFDDQVFSKLPDIFDFIANIAEDERERDTMTVGFFGVLSGIFPSVSGIHTGKRVWPNLYCAVYAPAGAGKGKLRVPRDIGNSIHVLLNDECQAVKKKHRQECADCKRDKNCSELPPDPSCKSLYIKGDISTSALKDYLQASETNVIYEMESYVMSKNKGKDWADSEDVFLNGWEHEPIGKSRVDDENDAEVNDPKLSLVVSGTPSMLDGLIPSVDSGFFSRTCFYVFNQELRWKDQFSDKQEATLTNVENTKVKLLEVFKFNRHHKVNIRFTQEQRRKHCELYSAWTEDLKQSGLDREYFASVARSGRVFFRIAMILSAIRRFEEKNASEEYTCHDEDFEIARSLCTTMNEHSKRVFLYLSKIKYHAQNLDDKSRILSSLSGEFLRRDAVTLGLSMGASVRSIDEWLKDWLEEGKVIRTGQGKYQVAKAAKPAE